MCALHNILLESAFCTNDNRIWGLNENHKCGTSCSKRRKKKCSKVLIFPFFPSLSLNLSWISLFAIEYCIPFSIYKCCARALLDKKEMQNSHYSAHVLPTSCWVTSSDWIGWTSLKLIKSSRVCLSICGLWSISMSRNKFIDFNNSISGKQNISETNSK